MNAAPCGKGGRPIRSVAAGCSLDGASGFRMSRTPDKAPGVSDLSAYRTGHMTGHYPSIFALASSDCPSATLACSRYGIHGSRAALVGAPLFGTESKLSFDNAPRGDLSLWSMA
jgi:hypothetical protein